MNKIKLSYLLSGVGLFVANLFLISHVDTFLELLFPESISLATTYFLSGGLILYGFNILSPNKLVVMPHQFILAWVILLGIIMTPSMQGNLGLGGIFFLSIPLYFLAIILIFIGIIKSIFEKLMSKKDARVKGEGKGVRSL